MPSIDYKSLREQISIREVLDLIAYQPLSERGDQWRGRCPVHDSQSLLSPSNRSRAFSVSLSKNAFQCFSCGAQGNQLDLWAAVQGMSLHDAALDLARRMGVEIER